MAGFTRITSDPQILGGQPCIRGMRLTVRRVLDLLATYPDRSSLFRAYPDLEEGDLTEALRYASALVADETIELPRAS